MTTKVAQETPKQLFSPTPPPFESPIFIYYTISFRLTYIYFL
jgi:hypothetical protein